MSNRPTPRFTLSDEDQTTVQLEDLRPLMGWVGRVPFLNWGRNHGFFHFALLYVALPALFALQLFAAQPAISYSRTSSASSPAAALGAAMIAVVFMLIYFRDTVTLKAIDVFVKQQTGRNAPQRVPVFLSTCLFLFFSAIAVGVIVLGPELFPRTLGRRSDEPWYFFAAAGVPMLFAFFSNATRPDGNRINGRARAAMLTTTEYHRRGSVLVTPEEARARALSKGAADAATGPVSLLPWGTSGLPTGFETQHFLAVGATGSGKTTAIRILMKWVLQQQMPASKDVRMLVFDSKGDFTPFLRTHAPSNIPVISLDPFDADGSAWAMAADYKNPADAAEFATLVVDPAEDRSNNPFFPQSARQILVALADAFIRNAPGAWDLRDILLATESEKTLRTVFSRTTKGKRVLEKFFSNTKTTHDILATLENYVSPYEYIAACWHQARLERPMLSFDDWLAGRAIVLLTLGQGTKANMAGINRLCISRLTELMLDEDQPEVDANTHPRRTWLFLDEFRELGELEGIHSWLTRSRSKGGCVVMGFQNLTGLQKVYGDHQAREIAGLPVNKCFLNLSDPETAQWASDLIGKREVIRRRPTDGESLQVGGDGGSFSQSFTEEIVETTSVLPSEFRREHSVDEAGLWAYYLSPTGAYEDVWTVQELEQLAPKSQGQGTKTRRAVTHQDLQPWDADDLARLGLPDSLLSDSEGPPPPEPPTEPSSPPEPPSSDDGGLGILGTVQR